MYCQRLFIERESMKKKIKVAIIDSGINTRNPKIYDSVIRGLSIYHDYDNNNLVYHAEHSDLNGHGTYCAEIIERFCPKVKLTIIKVLNKQKEGNSKCLIEALNYLIKNPVDIVNMSLATHNKKCENELRLVCDNLRKSGTIVISSLSNHFCSSYPAEFKSVIGVKGEIYLKEKEYIYNPNKTIQCHASGLPVLVEGLDGRYTFFGGNSKAAANLTGILSKLLSEQKDKKVIEPEKLLMSYCKDPNIDLGYYDNIEEIVYKDIDIKDKLLKERDFNRLLRLVEECLKIPREKSKLLLKYSLLNPIFSIHKDNFGKLIKAIEQEWKIQFDKGHVTLLCFESVESLYRLLKRTLNNEDN